MEIITAIIGVISSLISAIAPEFIKAWKEKREKEIQDKKENRQQENKLLGSSSLREKRSDIQDTKTSEPALESFSNLVKKGKYATAIEIAEIEKRKLEKSLNQETPNRSLILSEFDFWWARALMYTGNTEKAMKRLETIVSSDSEIQELSLSCSWRKRLLIGRIHNDIGYTNWMELGHYEIAIQELSVAIKFFASVNPDSDELATACDNIGRVYAQMGHRPRAEFLIEHGRQTRLKLDRNDRYALSLVSSAIAHLAFGNPYRSLILSEDALKEYLSVDEKNRSQRGIGLAKLVKGQALRRIGGLWNYSRPANNKTYLSELEKAVVVLNEALEIFDIQKGGVAEPIRFCQISNELGCTHREMFFITHDPEMFDLAEEYLQTGIQIAKQRGYTTVLIDGYEDLALLYSRNLDTDIITKAYEELDLAETIIEEKSPKSILREKKGADQGDFLYLHPKECIEEFWHQLGKIYAIRAHLLFGKETDPAPHGNKLEKAIENYVLAMGYFSLFVEMPIFQELVLKDTPNIENNTVLRKPEFVLRKSELMSHRVFKEYLYRDLRKLDAVSLKRIEGIEIPNISAKYNLDKNRIREFYGDIIDLLLQTKP